MSTTPHDHREHQRCTCTPDHQTVLAMTPGEDVFHWNVFWADGTSTLNQPFNKLGKNARLYLDKHQRKD